MENLVNDLLSKNVEDVPSVKVGCLIYIITSAPENSPLLDRLIHSKFSDITAYWLDRSLVEFNDRDWVLPFFFEAKVYNLLNNPAAENSDVFLVVVRMHRHPNCRKTLEKLLQSFYSQFTKAIIILAYVCFKTDAEWMLDLLKGPYKITSFEEELWITRCLRHYNLDFEKVLKSVLTFQQQTQQQQQVQA